MYTTSLPIIQMVQAFRYFNRNLLSALKWSQIRKKIPVELSECLYHLKNGRIGLMINNIYYLPELLELCDVVPT